MRVVLVTGGFDPLHSGHIKYFEAAKQLGDKLIVGLNSDDWLARKKGRPFMPLQERLTLVKALSVVDEVLTWDDSDDTACGAIFKLMATSGYGEEIIFANGGDRTKDNIPEMNTYHDKIRFEFGVGGDNKTNSSSWVLDEWKTQKTIRDWGYWRVLDDKPEKGYKVKELVIKPGKSLSDQRHFKRSEVWSILEGKVTMETDYNDRKESIQLKPHSLHYEIDKEVWHKASNVEDEDAHVLEVQWGECVEEDIERRD